jgi:hypothetical protein
MMVFILISFLSFSFFLTSDDTLCNQLLITGSVEVSHRVIGNAWIFMEADEGINQ